MAAAPEDLKYTASHEWIKVEGNIATIGITDHAQEELGDVVYVDLPTVGRVLQEGQTFGSIESVKAVSEVYAPVSGEVVEANPKLGSQSELINTDPYGSGYLIKIKLSGEELPSDLMSADAYTQSVS